MPDRGTAGRGQGVDRRANFIDVAIHLFGEGGYHGTTVPDIVDVSCSSTGTFYHYFSGKEDLLVQVLKEAGRRIAAEIDRAVAGFEGPIQRMQAAVEALFCHLVEHPDEGRVIIIEASIAGGAVEAARLAILESHERSVQAALGQLDFETVPRDSSVLARCWVGAVYEAARYVLEQETDQADVHRLARSVAEFNLRGIGVPMSPDGEPEGTSSPDAGTIPRPPSPR